MIIDKAGIVAIKNAWYDSARVNEHILHGYTKVDLTSFDNYLILCFVIHSFEMFSKSNQTLQSRKKKKFLKTCFWLLGSTMNSNAFEG